MAFPADYHSFLEQEISMPDGEASYLRGLSNAAEESQDLIEYLKDQGMTLTDREVELAENIFDYVEGRYLLEFRRMAVFLVAAFKER